MKPKYLLSVLILILVATMLTGCSAGPDKTVQKFFTALDKGKVSEATGYLSSATLSSLGMDKWQGALMEASNGFAEYGGIRSVKILEQDVQGDTARITFRITMGDGSEEVDTMDLVRENGDWKIHLDIWSK
jgi:hypothetical protein